MKSLAMVLASLLLCSCAGMRGDSSGSGGGTSSRSGAPSVDQMDINRHDSPSDPYFGG
jgi:hypothetical protein